MEASIISLIVFGIVIVFWITDKLPSSLVAMAGCLAMALLGICSLPEAMKGFTNDIVFLVVGMDILGNALQNTGAAKRIGQLAVQLSHDNEQRFLFFACIIAGIMSAFLSDSTVAALFMIICKSVTSSSKNIRMRNVAIPVCIAAIVGGTMTLVGSTPQLVAQSALTEIAGVEGFSMFSFTPIGAPAFIIYIVFTVFIGYPLGKRIWGGRKEEEIELTSIMIKEAGSTDVQWNKKKAPIVLVVLGIMVICFVFEFLSLGTISMAGGIVCILTGCITTKESYKKMNWNMIIWLAGCFSLANVLTISGANEQMTQFLAQFLNPNMSPFMFFAIVTLFSLVITQFMANTTVVVLILPIILPLATLMGISPYPVAMGVIMGASFAFNTPLACAHIAFSLVAGHKFSDYFRYTWMLTIIEYIMLLILIPLFFPL